MARDEPIALQFAQYVALRAVAGLIHCFDVEHELAVAASIGRVFYRGNAERRARAEGNIARAFPDWDRARVAAVAEASMAYMFQLFLVDAIVSPRLVTPSSWPRHLRFGELGPLPDHLVRGEPLIMLTAHCGNWELLGHVLALFGYPIAALARPLDNRFLDRWLRSTREARGTRIITKWGATPIVQDILRAGGRIGFTADQNAGEQGLFVPFFGRLASSYKSIGLLAIRYEVPIAAGVALRRGPGIDYEMTCTDFIRPEDWSGREDPLFYITARFNRAMERMVEADPTQYLWVHRRWKSRPRHERLGRPVPGRLEAKLRELPWLSEDDVQRIVDDSNRLARKARG